MRKIEAACLLFSCFIIIFTMKFRIKDIDTSIHNAVATSYKDELKVKKNDCLIPKISQKLDNQIRQQIKEIEEKEKQIQYDKDLYLLGQVIEAESGSNWIKDDVQFMVGNVVMNRILSDKFPNTIYDVVHAPNQYQFIKHGITIRPSKRALDNARKVLNGLRVLPNNVTYQSEYEYLGDGIYRKIKTKYSTIYFSYSK